MRDKFKMNVAIAGVSAVIAIIIFVIIGSGTSTITESYEYSLIKVVPYIFILAGALLGLNVFILLISGVVVAAVIGFGTSSFTFVEMAQAVGTGMADMFEISFFALFPPRCDWRRPGTGRCRVGCPQDESQCQIPQGRGVFHGSHGFCV